MTGWAEILSARRMLLPLAEVGVETEDEGPAERRECDMGSMEIE